MPQSGAPNDFAQWLTRDLRPRGASSALLRSEPPPSERPSRAQPVVITEREEPELASWLRQDLKPRGSLPPEALNATLLGSRWESVAPPSSAQPPASSRPPSDSFAPPESLSPESLPPESLQPPSSSLAAPPDSLVPHAVSEAPSALALREPELDAEDLAVLPSRRGKKRDWRKLVVLAALLSVLGAVLWVASGPQSQELSGAAAAAAPAVLTAPLPPPPPSDGELLEPPPEPEPGAPAVAPGKAAAATPAELELDSAPGRGGRRAGDAVARFADLPSPTLSRLAREGWQRARKATSPDAVKQPEPVAAP